MIIGLYSVKDELSEFAMPIPSQDDATIKRYFRNMVSENKMMMDNPEDFSIWKIGEYDTKEGKITSLAMPQLVERAKAQKNGNEESV